MARRYPQWILQFHLFLGSFLCRFFLLFLCLELLFSRDFCIVFGLSFEHSFSLHQIIESLLAGQKPALFRAESVVDVVVHPIAKEIGPFRPINVQECQVCIFKCGVRQRKAAANPYREKRLAT